MVTLYVGSISLPLHAAGWTEAEREHLGQELSDVLIYLVRLAEQCHVDLPKAVLDKFKLNALKYPEGKANLKYSTVENRTDTGTAENEAATSKKSD